MRGKSLTDGRHETRRSGRIVASAFLLPKHERSIPRRRHGVLQAVALAAILPSALLLGGYGIADAAGPGGPAGAPGAARAAAGAVHGAAGAAAGITAGATSHAAATAASAAHDATTAAASAAAAAPVSVAIDPAATAASGAAHDATSAATEAASAAASHAAAAATHTAQTATLGTADLAAPSEGVAATGSGNSAVGAFINSGVANESSAGLASITLANSFVSPSGRTCRQYVQDITIAGQPVHASGIVCKEPAGLWHVVSPRLPRSAER